MIQINPIKSAHLNFRFPSRSTILDETGTGLMSFSDSSTVVVTAVMAARGRYCAPPDMDEEGIVEAGFLGCLPIIQSVSCPVETAI